MNVGCVFPNRLHHDKVHDPDHRRVFAVGREPIDVDLFARFRLYFDAALGLLRFLDHVPQRLVYSHPAMHPTEGLGHALSVAIIGTTSNWTRRFTSSTANTLVGSTIATNSFPFKRATGTSLFTFAISRGISPMISSGIRIRARLTGDTFRQRPMLKAMS